MMQKNTLYIMFFIHFAILYHCSLGAFTSPNEFTLDLGAEEWEELGDAKYFKDDHIILWDGTHLEGNLLSLPNLLYSFGEVPFKVEEVSGILFFKQVKGIKTQYVTRNRQNFVANSKGKVWRFEKKEGEFKTLLGFVYREDHYETIEIPIEKIHFALLRKRKRIPKLIHKEILSVVLKEGDRFPFIPQRNYIRLFDESHAFDLKISEIQEIKFRGGLQGYIKGESVDRKLDFSFIKDLHFDGVLAKDHTYLEIPWHKVDRIIADMGRFIVDSPYAFSKWGPTGMVEIPDGKFVVGEAHMRPEVLVASKYLSPSAVAATLKIPELVRSVRSPPVEVYVPGFHIDKYEVTNMEYEKFIRETGHRSPPHWRGGVLPKGLESHPVVNVSFHDAQSYAQWAGKRLPTEIEWERAAKGIQGKEYAYGTRYNRTFANTESKGAKPVGHFEKTLGKKEAALTSFDELQDMTGNVAEWTLSYFHEEAYKELRQGEKTTHLSLGEPVSFRVVRGGSYRSTSHTATTTYRAPMHENDYNLYTGFRCIKETKR